MSSNKFSRTSWERLMSCDQRLRDIFIEVLETVDCSIITGFRDQETQDDAFRTGKSKIRWPNGKHNTVPSLAVDAAPWPIDWNDRERMTLFAGFVLGIAKSKGVTLRWGGTWAMDWQPKNNQFDDLTHYEIKETRKDDQ